MRIEGTTAVVTGAGNGIGRALALAFGAAGANVVVADVTRADAEAVAAEVAERGAQSLAVAVDVRDFDQVSDLADTTWSAFGSADILCNNAGVMAPAAPVWAANERDFDWTFGVNVAGVLNGLRAFVPRWLHRSEPAWIVNTGSEHSLGVPHLSAGLYNASKAAVLGLSDVARRELPDHIGMSILCPGIVNTTLWKASERRPEDLGGGLPADARGAAAMQLGKAPAEIAGRVLAAIDQEQFYIVTHAHDLDVAAERWQEVSAAFAAQSPRYAGDEAYAVDNVIQRLRAEAKNK